ncbi:MAG: hypothetical protein QF903_03615 [Planctomycetota bacterium]|jgi:hypothetical protein|nr:hypothetical protein [Planctomycetota bacterium]MDP6762730.1 hypothetical protein [Planctomycetota bacterium]MDP6988544.1 hypothetical protein [Planctomycetota bacterium]
MKAQPSILATALWLATAVAQALAAPDAPPAQGSPAAEAAPDAQASARERWQRLSAEEQTLMRERYERFRKMDAKQRRELTERHRRLEHTRRRVEGSLSSKERERLAELSEQARSELVGELVEEELRAQGRRMRAKLPTDLRERFERASPRQRQQFFVEFKEKTLPRMSRRAVTELARALDLGPQEERRIQALPPGERVEMVFELRKRVEAEAVEKDGLPAGLSRDRWEEIASLPPREFYEVAMRLDRLAHDGGPPDPEALLALPEAERRRRAADRILHAMRVSPEERLELADLAPKQRREAVEHRRRRRVMEIVRLHGLYADEELTRLEALDDGEFFAATRRLLQAAGPRRRGHRPPPRDGDPTAPHDAPRPRRHPAGPNGARPPGADAPGHRGPPGPAPHPRRQPGEHDRPPPPHPDERQPQRGGERPLHRDTRPGSRPGPQA